MARRFTSAGGVTTAEALQLWPMGCHTPLCSTSAGPQQLPASSATACTNSSCCVLLNSSTVPGSVATKSTDYASDSPGASVTTIMSSSIVLMMPCALVVAVQLESGST
ncbi:hypothetical protein AB1Y20_017029 [Prymnesium parvum]|uniref:Uncharacterized protein n=1 Tax=Prymnesium parvum TaxID=97485 RepID=A0AB34IB94_PRYPA